MDTSDDPEEPFKDPGALKPLGQFAESELYGKVESRQRLLFKFSK